MNPLRPVNKTPLPPVYLTVEYFRARKFVGVVHYTAEGKTGWSR